MDTTNLTLCFQHIAGSAAAQLLIWWSSICASELASLTYPGFEQFITALCPAKHHQPPIVPPSARPRWLSGTGLSAAGIGGLSGLQQLILRGCPALSMLPGEVSRMASLRLLDASECRTLTAIPNGVGALTSLQSLLLGSCTSPGKHQRSHGPAASGFEWS